ncbi:hypothetical protein C0195_01175 [Candidatus Bathyarchaeota archaeon]|nr:MAG: hypothetical protein C0195_01175 [Candidatus Bathyarchaeota archaeon]
MSSQDLNEIDKTKLPLFYRLILKVPGVDFLVSSSSGIFWAIIVPIFLILEFFLNFMLLILFPFPINIFLASIIPVAILLVCVRISLERFINWWNLNVGNNFKWDVEQSMQEYLTLLKKKEGKDG